VLTHIYISYVSVRLDYKTPEVRQQRCSCLASRGRTPLTQIFQTVCSPFSCRGFCFSSFPIYSHSIDCYCTPVLFNYWQGVVIVTVSVFNNHIVIAIGKYISCGNHKVIKLLRREKST